MVKKNTTAIEALHKAQEIAFAPFVFQTAISLRRLGILELVYNKRMSGGITSKDVAKELNIPEYGVDVLLEMAESSDMVIKDKKNRYKITKVGYFINSDEVTRVNLNFTNDVCYQGLSQLDESVLSGKPEGLKNFGNWDTVYQGLSELPDKAKKSWYEFDHHYSDFAFDNALKIVFKNKPKTIFDIGGNTGRFARSCFEYDSDVKVKILDLPGQVNIALKKLNEEDYSDRISGQATDMLSNDLKIPSGADVIWMSQFLDCFSKEEIIRILTACRKSMSYDSELIIMDLFTDNQRVKSTKFSLNATSLYFTAFANGNSKMYRSEEMIELVENSGLKINTINPLKDTYHTVLTCKKK